MAKQLRGHLARFLIAFFLVFGTQLSSACPARADEVRSLTGGVVATAGTWQKRDGTWYYVLEDGSTHVGWLPLSYATYYFNPDGSMKTGWLGYEGDWYYFTQAGRLYSGWLDWGSARYYFKAGGAMATGWQRIDGKWYVFGTNGKLTTNAWAKWAGSWYYVGEDGSIKTGWVKWSGKYYYFLPSGKMASGSTKIGDSWYYFGGGGAVCTGWQYLSGSWYYFGTDGKCTTSARTIGGVRFYFNASGRLLNVATQRLDLTKITYARLAELNGVDISYVTPGGTTAGSLLQFSNLQVPNPDGVTASMIDDFISSNCTYMEQFYGVTSSLRGQGQAFLNAAQACGVNVVYLVCHATIESAWGCSELSSGQFWKDPLTISDLGGVYYNYFGYGAYDTDPYNGGMRYAKQNGWKTPALAILGGAASISTSWVNATSRTAQRTPYEMRWDPVYSAQNGTRSYHEYASTKNFATLIGSQMAAFYSEEGITPNLQLVYPAFG